MDKSIDIVIPWVDGMDPKWLSEKEEYDTSYKGDKRTNRYRSWENLQFLFRGIEKNLPWVRRIHFVTWGHVPLWLNEEHPKLNIVKHQDYIPSQYLPTFSSHPIELNMHRIDGLSQQFIYANDDTFFLRPLDEEDFFVNGLPCDSSIENVHQFKKGGIDHIIANNLEVLNANFNKKESIKSIKNKWYSFRYGKKLLKNIYLYPFANFVGFENPHMPIPYLKATFEEVWKSEPEILEKTCNNKFRSNEDVNQWLFRYWQLASGNFHPQKPNKGVFFSIGKDDELIKRAITRQEFAMICLSDDDVFLNFEKEKEFLVECFEQIFPEKSSFEK